jgi:hypothetical protein
MDQAREALLAARPRHSPEGGQRARVHTKEFATMALSKSALSELLGALRAGGDLDLIGEALALVLQALIDAEATQHIGARP